MPIVRNLLISFGANLDKRSMQKVDQQAKGMATGLKQTFTAVLGIGFLNMLKNGIMGLTQMASAVNENKNVMRAAFGEMQGDVEDWAKTFADSAGRSRYEMEQMAGQLGALLMPLTEDVEKTTEWSKALTQLAVDLGSFYNVADEQAMTAIRSGLVGETEPLKRFGIVMNQAALQTFAREQGLKANIKAMSESEKAELRYQFIMEKTALAQGDAARTAHEFANSQKALQSELKDLGVGIGRQLLPAMGWIVRQARGVVSWFGELIENTNVVRAALIVLAGVAAKVAIAFLPLALPFIKIGLVIAALTLIIDDFITFLEGGDSVIGRFIDWLVGPGSAAEAAAWLRKAFEDFVNWAKEVLIPGIASMGKAFVQFVVQAEPYIRKFLLAIGDGFVWVWNSILKPFINWFTETALPGIISFAEAAWPVLQAMWNAWYDVATVLFDNVLKPLFGFLASDGIAVISAVASTIGSVLIPVMETLVTIFTTVFGWIGKIVDAFGEFINGAIDAADKAGKFLGMDFNLRSRTEAGAAVAGGRFGRATAAPSGVLAGFGQTVPASTIGAVTTMNRSMAQTVNINQPVNVTVPPGAPQNMVQNVAGRTAQAVRNANRQTAAALKQQAE